MMLSLLYHDVVPPGREDASGFPGPGAARYKITPAEFLAHAGAVARALGERPVVAATDLLRGAAAPSGVMLTFDDGGVSAFTAIADVLERHGWRGHFFVTTDYLDSPTFVSSAQVRELNRRGHVVGSHSCSHPERMSSCAPEVLLREWQESCSVLSDVLGAPVTTASVPGGYYSHAVAAAAARAGVTALFNSEPTRRTHTVDGCLVLGRYTLYRGMSAASAAGLASGKTVSCLGQALLWKMKKIAKTLGGRSYLGLRATLLRRAYGEAKQRTARP